MATSKRYDTSKQWYAIHTYSGYEEKVAESIRQTVRAHHRYPDASNSTSFVAAALARQLRGQTAEITAINCRFRARRLDCEAIHIHTPTHQLRKDQQ